MSTIGSTDDHAPAAPRPRRRFLVPAIAFAILAAAVAAGLIPRLLHRAAIAEETAELAIPTVTVVRPAPAPKEAALLIPAEIRASIEAPIHARTSGYLRRWHADLGTVVREGQLLAELDTPELDRELDRAGHELRQAQAALDLATTTAARYAELLKTASVGEQEEAEKRGDLALKSAAVDALRANVTRLASLRSFGRITAPFAGRITARGVDVGELVMAGSSRPLFLLAKTDALLVRVLVPQSRAAAIRPGQQAELTIPERPNQTFAATVARTAGAISPDSRTLLVELELDNRDGEILPGTFGQVRFPGTGSRASSTLPGNTLLFRPEGPRVGVVGADGRVTLREVKLGRDFGTTVEILAGIDAADRVILNPSDSLTSGIQVRVAPSPAEETP
jgi:RND family efflux transporter MFP subunit